MSGAHTGRHTSARPAATGYETPSEHAQRARRPEVVVEHHEHRVARALHHAHAQIDWHARGSSRWARDEGVREIRPSCEGSTEELQAVYEMGVSWDWFALYGGLTWCDCNEVIVAIDHRSLRSMRGP